MFLTRLAEEVTIDACDPFGELADAHRPFGPVAAGAARDAVFGGVGRGAVHPINPVPGVDAREVDVSVGGSRGNSAIMAVTFKEGAGFLFRQLELDRPFCGATPVVSEESVDVSSLVGDARPAFGAAAAGRKRLPAADEGVSGTFNRIAAIADGFPEGVTIRVPAI